HVARSRACPLCCRAGRQLRSCTPSPVSRSQEDVPMTVVLDGPAFANDPPPTVRDGQASSSSSLLRSLREQAIVSPEHWEELTAPVGGELEACPTVVTLLDRLVELGLLTEYQAQRVRAGRSFGLVLGNYRVLDRLGAGGMGVVYRAEHRRMRRMVAVKVL